MRASCATYRARHARGQDKVGVLARVSSGLEEQLLEQKEEQQKQLQLVEVEVVGEVPLFLSLGEVERLLLQKQELKEQQQLEQLQKQPLQPEELLKQEEQHQKYQQFNK